MLTQFSSSDGFKKKKTTFHSYSHSLEKNDPNKMATSRGTINRELEVGRRRSEFDVNSEAEEKDVKWEARGRAAGKSSETEIQTGIARGFWVEVMAQGAQAPDPSGDEGAQIFTQRLEDNSVFFLPLRLP